MSNDEKKAIIKRVMANSYLELEDQDNVMLYTTRQNGDMTNDEPGAADLQHAYHYRKLLMAELPDIESRVEGVDEWTYLTIIL